MTEKERIKSSDRQEKRKHPLLPTKTKTSTDGVSRREEVWSGKRAKANASIDYKNSETRRGLVMTPPCTERQPIKSNDKLTPLLADHVTPANRAKQAFFKQFLHLHITTHPLPATPTFPHANYEDFYTKYMTL